MLAQPRVLNLRRGRPLCEPLSGKGIASTILRCPCTFAPEALDGRMLAGVGVPDLRGSQSKGTFYTQDRTATALDNEQLIVLDSGATPTTRVLGPRNTRHSPPSDAFC